MKLHTFFYIILITVVFSFAQFFNFSIFGIKPNFIIALVPAISLFITEIWEGIFIVSLAAFILKFSPDFNNAILVLFVLGILIVALAKYLPWHYFVNCIFLIFIYTVSFYALLSPLKITSAVFLRETFYNILLGTLIFSTMPKNSKH